MITVSVWLVVGGVSLLFVLMATVPIFVNKDKIEDI